MDCRSRWKITFTVHFGISEYSASIRTLNVTDEQVEDTFEKLTTLGQSKIGCMRGNVGDRGNQIMLRDQC